MKFRSKGFTLIELLVVVAIISLLSSIVLASVKEAREKAQASKFRQELQQLVVALELYKTENGKYPYETEGYLAEIRPTGEVITPSTKTQLSVLLSNYIKTLPKTPDGMNYAYYSNVQNNSQYRYRCAGETNFPPYVLYFTTASGPISVKGITDLPSMEALYTNGTWNTSLSSIKCFSTK